LIACSDLAYGTRRFATPTDSLAAARSNVAPEVLRAITRHAVAQPAEIVRHTASRSRRYVPEERRIFTELTVAENPEVGRRPGPPLWRMDRRAHLRPLPQPGRHARPPGRTDVRGEQQMLTIGRSLMGNPRLILLDEPIEGLAPVIIERMADAILALKRDGMTLLLSEQNLHFARLVSDRACVLEKCEIRWKGSMAALMAAEEVRANYLTI